ncbi:MAG: energy transducer TonB [Gallionella sp.]|nr:MAG: energy transducer TonB [Gallionella sp.]
MLEFLPRIKSEKLIGLLFVLALHGAGLYGLWSYRIIPTPDEAVTLMVNLINPPPPEQAKPPKPVPPPPPKPRPPELPKHHQHLAVEAPVVLPDEPVEFVPPPAPAPAVAAPPSPSPPVFEAPPQPVVLSGELSVSCPERSPPHYPLQSKRFNEQGKVVLRVELGEDGQVADVAVKTSSGYRRLDDAALNAVKAWRCKPAMQNGIAVRAVALQPFNFILEGR